MRLIYPFIIGSILGSFLGVVIDRFPTGETIIFGRSHCNGCQKILRAWELIPILSALISGFRCRSCHIRIPFWYAELELACGLLFVGSYSGLLNLSQTTMLLMSAILSIFDWKYHEFPLVVWTIFTTLIFFISPFQPLNFIWLFLSVLAEFIDLKIGSGDLLWLYDAALTLTLLQVIWVVQIASLIGIFLYFLIKKNNEIAFIPCLTVAYIMVSFFLQVP